MRSLNSTSPVTIRPPSPGPHKWLVEEPIAHRGLHDAQQGIFENTMAAWQASIDAGFPIECDLQITADRKAVVFHDPGLKRMTGRRGLVRHHTAAELAKISIMETGETIRTLEEHLELANGKVLLLIELKGILGEDDGLAEAAADALSHYHGPAGVMSFHHWLAAKFQLLMPNRPRGLTALGDDHHFDFHARAIKEYDLQFVSYRIRDLPCRVVTDMRQLGFPVITWTVRTKEECALSYEHGDQITFEGFDPRVLCP